MDRKPLEYEPAHRKLKGLRWMVVVVPVVGGLFGVASFFGSLSHVKFTATGSIQYLPPTSTTQPAAIKFDADLVSEREKIDAMIAHIENLDGSTFYRNGEWHAAKDAAAHLRRKRDYVGDKLKTAEQFIDELASKSSSSGEAYRIKLKDGTEAPAGDYLRGQLPEIEKALREK